MVWHRMTRHVTGSFGPAYDVQKVFPFGIAQEVLNVASQPKFNTVVGPLRQLFIDDMTMRRFSLEAERNYLRDVRRFAT